jgi:hypothetical protein
MPIGIVALRFMHDRNAARTRFRKKTVERRSLVIASDSQFADLKICEHGA